MHPNSQLIWRLLCENRVLLCALVSSLVLCASIARADGPPATLSLRIIDPRSDLGSSLNEPFSAGDFTSAAARTTPEDFPGRFSLYGHASFAAPAPDMRLSLSVGSRASLQMGFVDPEGLFGFGSPRADYAGTGAVGGSYIISTKSGVFADVQYWYARLLGIDHPVLKVRMEHGIKKGTSVGVDVGTSTQGGPRRVIFDLRRIF